MNLSLVPQISGNWNMPPAAEAQLKNADCIVGFSFGLRENNQPGSSNEALAKVIVSLTDKYDLPVMVQWEIADCLPFKLPSHRIVRKHRVKGEYLDSREVAIQFAAELLREPLAKPINAAHPLHMWRCLKNLEKLGFQNPVQADCNAVPCDPQSTQWWTRHPSLFIPHEIYGRWICIKKGWI